MVETAQPRDQATSVSNFHSQPANQLTPIGPYDRMVVFFAFFNALPEYLTILWIVNAGRPILATVWKIAL